MNCTQEEKLTHSVDCGPKVNIISFVPFPALRCPILISSMKSLFDTYLFMSFVEGQSLDTAWETYDSITRNQVTNQLKEYLHELRQISHRNYIGSVDFGPVTDPILESHHVKGPTSWRACFPMKSTGSCSCMGTYTFRISWSRMDTSVEFWTGSLAAGILSTGSSQKPSMFGNGKTIGSKIWCRFLNRIILNTQSIPS
ncbi:uncharacterized protein AFUA_8G01870 [Aspergillus fumigatus Af293]|uniref:Uncharacterized protein n=1 Tax=Aspergillus fumigatus (strain ATCC MYA-4609 / CBS 101355 / FGSC A1100 / Af293) TaxID=330879 RepID=Q4WBD1_ASPFU|nr:hypothetical protein AFUA_8G01870 [Aspergillus fumigatus Af293]EAL84981.1 hypothetical protein AFUA_8G01870 [Aspergillus fumigatus Af293]